MQKEKQFFILYHYYLVRMDRSGSIRRGGNEEAQKCAEDQIPRDPTHLHNMECYEITYPEST